MPIFARGNRPLLVSVVVAWAAVSAGAIWLGENDRFSGQIRQRMGLVRRDVREFHDRDAEQQLRDLVGDGLRRWLTPANRSAIEDARLALEALEVLNDPGRCEGLIGGLGLPERSLAAFQDHPVPLVDRVPDPDLRALFRGRLEAEVVSPPPGP